MTANTIVNLPPCYTGRSMAEKLYNGKLRTAYVHILAAYSECSKPPCSLPELNKLAMRVAVAESFPNKTAFLECCPTEGLLQQEHELSPFKWMCLLLATGFMHQDLPDLARVCRKTEQLLRGASHAAHP